MKLGRAVVIVVSSAMLATSAWAQQTTAAPPAPPPTAAPSAPTPTAQPPPPPPQGWGYPYPYWYYYPGYYPPPNAQAPTRPVGPPGVPKKRRDKGLMVAGILMASGGAVAAIVGSALIGVADDRYDVYCEDANGAAFLCTKRNDATMMTGGALMTIVGGLSIAVGIPLWVIGGKMVPVEAQPTTEPAPAPPPRADLRVGPGGLTLSGHF